MIEPRKESVEADAVRKVEGNTGRQNPGSTEVIEQGTYARESWRELGELVDAAAAVQPSEGNGAEQRLASSRSAW